MKTDETYPACETGATMTSCCDCGGVTRRNAAVVACLRAARFVTALFVLMTLGGAKISPASDTDYWTNNLPVDTTRLQAPHIPAPYTCRVNYFVSKTGSDANNGSVKAPWLTISHAVAALNAQGTTHGGVCVHVGDGVYAESVSAGALSGSADTPDGYFVLRSLHPHRAIIRLPMGLPDYSNLIGFWNARYIVIDGFTLIGNIVTSGNRNSAGIETSGDSASVCHSHHIKVLNNIVHDISGSGIASHYADYWTVAGNVVYNTSNTSTYGVSAINNWHPVALDARSGFHLVVRDNISFHNAEVDINAPHWDGNGITFDDFNGASNAEPGFKAYVEASLVENNLCFDNGGAGFLTGGSGSSYITIRNNTFFDNYLDPQNTATVRGEISVENSHDVVVVNNICVANPVANAHTRAFVDTGAGNVHNVWRNNLSFNGDPGQASVLLYQTPSTITSENGNLLGIDPLFVNMKAGNLRLRPGSPALRKGCTQYGVPDDDLSGARRSHPPSIGAFDAP